MTSGDSCHGCKASSAPQVAMVKKFLQPPCPNYFCPFHSHSCSCIYIIWNFSEILMHFHYYDDKVSLKNLPDKLSEHMWGNNIWIWNLLDRQQVRYYMEVFTPMRVKDCLQTCHIKGQNFQLLILSFCDLSEKPSNWQSNIWSHNKWII